MNQSLSNAQWDAASKNKESIWNSKSFIQWMLKQSAGKTLKGTRRPLNGPETTPTEG